MNRILCSAFLVFFFGAYTLQAQVAGNYNYNTHGQPHNRALENIRLSPPPNAVLGGKDNLMLSINGLINAKADAYMAIFNLTQVGARAGEADSLVAQRIDGFREAALAAGIEAADFYVDMLSFVPVYEYEVEKKIFSKKYNEVPKGFELQKNIHILYRDPRVLDQLVTAAAKQEIYDLIKVEYFVENTQEHLETLRAQCMELLQKKMEEYKELGFQIDTTYHVLAEAHQVAFPVERYRQYQAFSSASVDAARKRDKVNDLKKPTAMFYEKMPYNGYDVVINPILLEPAVQYTYNLKAHFYLTAPQPRVVEKVKREKEFIWITQEGDVKPLKID